MEKEKYTEFSVALEQHRIYLRSSAQAGRPLVVSGLDLSEISLADQSLRFASLIACRFENANLSNADLFGVRASNASFAGANLRGANLSQGVFTRADFTRAELSAVHAVQALFYGANFDEAILEGANFQRANLGASFLGSANLREANLEGASLNLARLYQTDLLDAVGCDTVHAQTIQIGPAYEMEVLVGESTKQWLERAAQIGMNIWAVRRRI